MNLLQEKRRPPGELGEPQGPPPIPRNRKKRQNQAEPSSSGSGQSRDTDTGPGPGGPGPDPSPGPCPGPHPGPGPDPDRDPDPDPDPREPGPGQDFEAEDLLDVCPTVSNFKMAQYLTDLLSCTKDVLPTVVPQMQESISTEHTKLVESVGQQVQDLEQYMMIFNWNQEFYT